MPEYLQSMARHLLGNADDYDDDEYYGDDGFDGYIETTVDPGPWILVGTTLYCLLTVIALPVSVILYNRRKKRHSKYDLEKQLNVLDEEEKNWDKEKDYARVGTWTENGDNSSQSRHPDLVNSAPNNRYGNSTGECSRSSRQLRRQLSLTSPSVSSYDDLKKLALVTSYVNRAVDKIDSSTRGHDNHPVTPSVNGLGNHSTFSGRSRGSSSIGLLRHRGSMHFRSKTRSKLSSRSHGIHKALYNETREDHCNTNSAQVNIHINMESEIEMTSNHPRSVDYVPSEMFPEDAVDAYDPGKEDFVGITEESSIEVDYDICCGPNPFWSPVVLMQAFHDLADLAAYDKESQRLIKLAGPFTLSALIETLLDNVELVIIARNISTNALAAYAVCKYCMPLQSFCKGHI